MTETKIKVRTTLGVTDHNLLDNRFIDNQHTINAISGLEKALESKQDVLTAGENIEISEENVISATGTTYTAGENIEISEENVISATDTTYTAGTGIDITNGVISNTQTSAEWGNIEGDLNSQTDLKNAFDTKANSSDLATVAISGSYNDLSNKPNLSTVAISGSYNDLSNKPTISDGILTIQKNGTTVDTFTANSSANKTVNLIIPTTASDISAMPNSVKYASSITVNIDSSNYQVTTTLKDQDGNTLGTAQVIDLPLESVVVSGSYDRVNKNVVLTLQNGSDITFSVADLVSGLQSEITTQNKLDADLIDDSASTNKFVTSSDKSTWDAKQDAISDLATIRAGANAGATAIQSSDLATVATSGAYSDLSGTPSLATVATSGSYNDLSNKPTVIPADNSTITENASNQLQAVGIVNQNTNVGAVSPLKIWNGTEQEWNTGGGSQTWYCWRNPAPSSGNVGTVYTAEQNPTTSSIVYSAPNVVSNLTIIGVYTSDIIGLSNGDSYMYNAYGNQTTTATIGQAHPDWICNIDGLGVKKGNTLIANLSSAVWGSIAGTLSDQTDLQTALNAKIENNSTTGGSYAIGRNATATGQSSYTYGQATQASGNYGVALGYYAKANANYSISIGYNAIVDGKNSIQIGPGTNSTVNSLQVTTYPLLDLMTGKIPNDRLSAFSGATSSVAGSVGAVPAPTTSDVDKYLKGDGTWAAVSGVQNNATGAGAYAIGVSATASGMNSSSYGNSAHAEGSRSTALGYYATVNARDAIQIGQGINSTNDTAQVGAYPMLDLTTGIIPLARMPYTAGAGVTISNTGEISASGGGSGIQNTATGTNSLTILGEPTSAPNAINIGSNTTAGESSVVIGGRAITERSVAIGTNCDIGGADCIAIGNNAHIGGGVMGAVQLGYGQNSTSFTLNWGWYNANDGSHQQYLIVDGNGKIPNDRINGVSGSFTSQDGKTVTVTNGVITSIV